MWSNSNSTHGVQETPNLTIAQIYEDIRAIAKSEQERDKLFNCLDNKNPSTHTRKYAEMESFLEGAQKLEDISKALQEHVKKLGKVSECLTTSLSEIEEKIAACQ